MEMDYAALSARLSRVDGRVGLVQYIYAKGAGQDVRIDYKDAARELGVSARTIGRYVKQLADRRIVILGMGDDGKGVIGINSELLKIEIKG